MSDLPLMTWTSSSFPYVPKTCSSESSEAEGEGFGPRPKRGGREGSNRPRGLRSFEREAPSAPWRAHFAELLWGSPGKPSGLGGSHRGPPHPPTPALLRSRQRTRLASAQA